MSHLLHIHRCRLRPRYCPPLLPPLGIFRLVIIGVAVLGANVVVVPALLIDGRRGHIISWGVLSRRGIVSGIDNKFIIFRLYDLSFLVDIRLLGLVVNAVVLLLIGFVLL